MMDGVVLGCVDGGVRFLGWLRVLVAINRRAVLLRKQPVIYDQQKKEPYNLKIMPRMAEGQLGKKEHHRTVAQHC